VKNGAIAIFFDQLGPYHWARLQAAARLFHVVAIETCAVTCEYQWERIDQPRAFDRVTLFDDISDGRSSKRALLRQKLTKTLSEADPAAAMIPGWATPASLIALDWSAHLLVGTKTVASAVNAVHAGLTFNLGRDITLLVLWPVIFAYFFVRLSENWAMKRFGPLPQLATVAPANAGPGQVLAGQLSQ
jgi:hypothetical protein